MEGGSIFGLSEHLERLSKTGIRWRFWRRRSISSISVAGLLTDGATATESGTAACCRGW